MRAGRIHSRLLNARPLHSAPFPSKDPKQQKRKEYYVPKQTSKTHVDTRDTQPAKRKSYASIDSLRLPLSPKIAPARIYSSTFTHNDSSPAHVSTQMSQIGNTLRPSAPMQPVPACKPNDVYTFRQLTFSPQPNPDRQNKNKANFVPRSQRDKSKAKMNKRPPRPAIQTLAKGLSDLPKSLLVNVVLQQRRLAQTRQISQSQQTLQAAKRKGHDDLRISSLWKPRIAQKRSDTNSLFSRLFAADRAQITAKDPRLKRLRRPPASTISTQLTRPKKARTAARPLGDGRVLVPRPNSIHVAQEHVSADRSMFSRLFYPAKEYLPEAENEGSSQNDSHLLVDVNGQEFAAFANVPEVDSESEEEYWILNGSPKSLVASDFQRLIQGIHITSWEHQFIMYQAYNPATYTPLDQYVLKFSNAAEALAFTTAFEAQDSRDNSFFTIAPPNLNRTLSLTKISRSSSGHETPAFNLAGAVKARLGAKYAVHIRLELGEARIWEMWNFIKADGQARGNMEWAIHRPYVLKNASGIGISSDNTDMMEAMITEQQQKKQRARLVQRPGLIVLKPRADLEAFNDAEWKQEMWDQVGGGRKISNKDGQSHWHQDFAMGFGDVEEARRFVRRWHRRYVTMAGGGEVLLNVRLLNGGFEPY